MNTTTYSRMDGPDHVARVLAAIEQHGVAERVTYTGRANDAQLAGLYQGCLAVCVPSVAEGFGLPVLEAAAAGAPVVAFENASANTS